VASSVALKAVKGTHDPHYPRWRLLSAPICS
jgi:hypothetical protein